MPKFSTPAPVPALAARSARLCVLISGGGRTLLNLHARCQAGEVPARVVHVICSRPDAAGMARAREAGLEVSVVSRKGMTEEAFQQALSGAVLATAPELVLMAGFLSLWRFPDAFWGRILNIHPSLLPAFGGPGMYGMRVHEAVLRSGAAESGCTVHFCDYRYDSGPIILQRRIPIEPHMTREALAARVFEEECIAYPEAVRRVLDGRAHWSGPSDAI